MSKRTSFSPSKAAKAALGDHGFVALIPELLQSTALRTLSINAVRVLFFLMNEHITHCGKENGFLVAPYRQLVAYGISSRLIKSAIDELVDHGLLEITHHGRYGGGAKLNPTKYRLTFLPWKFIPATGAPQYLEPTHEWKNYRQNDRPAKPLANGHDRFQLNRRRVKMNGVKRDIERDRYLKINAPTFGLKEAQKRWAVYEQLILAKYGNPKAPDFEKAWNARDRAH